MSHMLPSSLEIGEVCAVQFNTEMKPIKGTIVGIGFTESKVLYDVAVWVEETDGPYTSLPLQKVDSYFCSKWGKESNFGVMNPEMAKVRKHKVKHTEEVAGLRLQMWKASALRRLEK